MGFDLDEDLRAMADRALALLEQKSTHLTDDVWYEPVANYTDPERFRRELGVLFGSTPLLMGLSCQWPEPGSFTTFDHIPGRPLLISRGQDGRLRAFLNVCRHRGARVVHDAEGCTRRHACPFHAWTYDSGGALVGLPFREGFPGVEPADHGLTEVPCEERDGMVWVVPSPDASMDLDQHLGDLGPQLAAYGFDTAEKFVTHRLDASSWKLAVDTYLEGYHFASLHPKTINPINYDNLVAFDAYGPHCRQGFPRRIVGEMAARPRSEWDVLAHISIVYLVFPNVAFTMSPEGILLNQVFPGATPDTSVTLQTHYTRAPITSDEQRAVMEQRASLVRDVVRDEDYWMTASIQDALLSGANETLVFGRNEPGLHHFHRALDEATG